MNQRFAGTYAMFPYFVMVDPQLSYGEKCIYSCILYLNQMEKGCFASNQYFADRYQLSLSTVSHALCKLERLGYIGRETDHHSGTRYIVAKERGVS